MLKSFLTFLACLIGFCPADHHTNQAEQAPMVIISSNDINASANFNIYRSNTISGNFLASRFAQNNHDWLSAGTFLDQVLRKDKDNKELINKAMVLAIGAGQAEKAIKLAHKLLDTPAEETNADTPEMIGNIAHILLAVDAIKSEKYDELEQHLIPIKSGGLADFIKPLLESWNSAAQGKENINSLFTNTIHIYHAILIKAFLGDTDGFDLLLQRAIRADGLSVQDLERIGDVYTYLKDEEKALEIYKQALQNWPDNQDIADKIALLEDGAHPVFMDKVENVQQGAGLAFYDIAQLLFREQSDESTRVFANIAHYLYPDFAKPHILLGYVYARQDLAKQAISHYKEIPETDKYTYRKAQSLIADLYEDNKQTNEAVAVLDTYAQQSGEIDPLIQIGDIYRRADTFDKAIKYYDLAAQKVLQLSNTDKLPPEYWHLHYVRGMALERAGDWKRAEKDLQAALEYRPDDALILNYLGYAWADQDENLDQALEMIEKAAALEPQDGYIIDSLGWVLYRMNRFEEAIPPLERAIELLPYDPTVNDHLGDAYWRVGRKIEARFQWERALNNAEDESTIPILNDKIENGLPPVLQASSTNAKTGS